jgi:hypothetical protein
MRTRASSSDIMTGKTYKAHAVPAVHSEYHLSRRLAEVHQGGGNLMPKIIAVIRGDGIVTGDRK